MTIAAALTLKHGRADADVTYVRLRNGLRGAILAGLVVVSGAGCAASIHVAAGPVPTATQAAPDAAPGSVPAPKVAFSTGDWTATGTFLQTEDADFRPGEVITRPWWFRKICNAGACHIVLMSETVYGVETAPVVRYGDQYVVHWPAETVPCPHYPGQDAGSIEAYSTLMFSWSKSHNTLVGIESTHYFGQACGGGTPDVVRWVVSRTNPSARSPAVGP